MKKLLLHITLVFNFITVTALFAQGVTFDNTGGTIKNNGIFRVRAGQVKAMPDTIGGRVEFTASCVGFVQMIPNITYNQLELKGNGVKRIDQLKIRPLETQDSLLLVDSAKVELYNENIHAKAAVENTVDIIGDKEVRLNGIQQQDIFGAGKYPVLNIDNPAGVNIIRNGGFTVKNKLELTNGVLRNNTANNFTMADSSTIVRHSEGSLNEEPLFGANIDLRYVGGKEIISGKEVPTDTTIVKNLIVENSGGLTFSKNITVKDSVFVTTKINTELDTLNKFVLNYTGSADPQFVSPEAEIIGSLRRTVLKFDSTVILMNNKYTYALFKDSASANGIRELTFRVKPRTFPPFMQGNSKVMRFIQISAKDENYNDVSSGLSLKVGFGWKNSPDTSKDETNGLPINQLVFQRWNGTSWINETQEYVPTLDVPNDWAYNYAINVSQLGDFAIGLPGNSWQLVMMAKAILEGPYRTGAMAFDLRTKNLIPSTPPDIYPYNLDPKRPNINILNLPDSIVDWVVVEFRPILGVSNMSKFITCFLKSDGTIISRNGDSVLNLFNEGIDSGDYFIALRHRNHLPVITKNALHFYPSEKIDNTVDFSRAENILGGTSSLKVLGFKTNGSLLFGLIAGDINGDGKVDDFDMISTWEDRDYNNLYKNTDVNMSGFFNTKDFNYVWNNKGKTSNVPK